MRRRHLPPTRLSAVGPLQLAGGSGRPAGELFPNGHGGRSGNSTNADASAPSDDNSRQDPPARRAKGVRFAISPFPASGAIGVEGAGSPGAGTKRNRAASESWGVGTGRGGLGSRRAEENDTDDPTCRSDAERLPGRKAWGCDREWISCRRWR